MLAKFSVKKPYTVIVAIILVIALGVISFIHMTTDLLPSMDLPYVIVYTTYTGATPESVESDVTRPLEAAFSTLTDVKNVTSTSSENLSLVVMEFEAGADMNTAVIEINSDIEQLRGGWDDDIGTPVIMKLNPDMLPVTVSTVSLDDADLLELSDYVEDELLSKYEAVDGVARVTPSGILTQQVDITIEQNRIDAINNAILREIDDELADVELQLRDAQSQLSSGKSQLWSMRSQVFGQIDEALKAIDEGKNQLPQAIQGITLQRAQEIVMRDAARQTLDGITALQGLDEQGRQGIQAAGQTIQQNIDQLQTQRGQLQTQLEALGGDPDSATQRQLAAAQSALTEQQALKANLESYINNLTVPDKGALESTVAQLQLSLMANEANYTQLRGEFEAATAEREAASARVKELEALYQSLGGDPEATAADTGAPATDTPAPDAEATGTPEASASAEASGTPAPDAGAGSTPAADGETSEGGGSASPDATGAPETGETQAPTDAPETGATAAPEGTQAPEETGDTGGDASGDTGTPGDTGADDSISPGNSDHSGDSGESGQDGAGESQDSGAPAAQSGVKEPDAMPAVHDEPASAPESSEGEQTASLWDALSGAARAEGQLTMEQVGAMLAEARAREAEAIRDEATLEQRCNDLARTLNEQQNALSAAQEALRRFDDEEGNFAQEIEAAQAQLDTCNARIEALQAEIAECAQQLANGTDQEKLSAQIAQLDRQIAALEAEPAYQSYQALQDPDALNARADQARAAVIESEMKIAGYDAMLDKLNRGILPAGMIPGIDQDTDLASARIQLLNARSQAASGFSQAAQMLNDAEAELAEAWKEFTDNRDEALENAGIDGIITTQTISQILGSQNLDLPAGYVANADDRYLVSIGTEFASLDELRRVKLFSLGMETVDDVRLFDVADVQISDNSEDLFTFVNGENGIMLSFEKQSTASTAEVAENITAESERLMAENERLHVTEMMNQGDYINLIVDSVLDNLLYGGGLAILVLLLFLLDWRPTLIVAISIPASVVVAFVCMYFTGITLNVMSLSGLALGVGMLVDNSIVSIENIYRLRDEEGLPILTASIRGVNQVAGALFASTLTTICVFLPVVFVEGMARDLFTDMGLTIAFSLLASLAVAMTVVPSAAATLFKKKKVRKQRIFGAIQRGYVAMLRGALRVKPLVLLAAVALLAYSGYQVLDMGISFMPSVNSEQMSASLDFEDPDMPDSEREAAAISIMDEIMQVEGVKDVSLNGASSMSLMGGGSGYSYYILVDTTLGRKNADIAAEMQERASAYADGERAVFSAQVSTMDLSVFAGEGITVDIAGDDIQALRDASVEVAAICAQVDGAINVDDGAEEAEPKLAVIVDKELASDNSLSVAQVYQYVAQRLYGAVELTDATLDGREYTLYVNEDKNIDLAPSDIADMEIEVEGTTETHFVRIGDIATIVDGESMSSIRRDNQKRVTSVSFEVADGYSANLVSRDLEEKLATYQPPEGVEISLSGENENVMGYMKDMLTMLGIAVLFIFLIMVAQFQSFKSPIIVMFTIPLAFTGGLLALLITHMDLSIIAMVGFLVLSGVVVNNGIVFIDSVNQMRINGMEKREALIETGRIRLRPILMTALTTILGMSTMAMAKGMGAEMMQPMAVVTIGGLSYATLMTLFVVPVLYDLLNGKKMKAREIEMMKEAAGMHREGFDDEAEAEQQSKPQPLPEPEPEPEAEPEPEVEPQPEPEPDPEPEPPKPAKPMRIRMRR